MLQSPSFIKVATTMLTPEEEADLFEQWKAARDAGNRREENALFSKITVQFSPIVAKLVRKMRGYRLDQRELTSEALLALCKAAIDFDPSKGFRFGTYASNCVINTLYTFVTKQYFMANVCSNAKYKRVFFGLRRHMAAQIKLTGHFEMTHEVATELADSMQVTPDIIMMMSSMLRNPYSSLNQVVSEEDDSMTKQDMLVSPDANQDDLMEEQQLTILQSQLINGALTALDERSRVIVQRSVLVEDDAKQTLEELGAVFSISKERVRQIRDKATGEIRQHIRQELMKRGFRPTDILPT